MKKLAFSFFILSSCSPGFELPKGYKAPVEVVPFVEQYLDYREEYIGSRKIDYPLTFAIVNIPDSKIGYCYAYRSGRRYIELDSKFWSTASDNQKFMLILHEMGHCDLERFEHVAPKSIMEPAMLPELEVVNNLDYYINELFQPDTRVSSKLTFEHSDVILIQD